MPEANMKTDTKRKQGEYAMPDKTEELPIETLLEQVKVMAPEKAGEYLINKIENTKNYDWLRQIEDNFTKYFRPIFANKPTVHKMVWDRLQMRAMDLFNEISGNFRTGTNGGNGGSIDDLFKEFDSAPAISKSSASAADAKPEDFIAPIDLGQYAANLNDSSVFMSREDIKKRLGTSAKPKENARYYSDSQIKEYLTQCFYELQSYRRKNEKTGAMLTERLLKTDPKLLYAFAAETVDKKTDGEEFKKDLKYRTGVYYNIISCRNLLKNLLEPIDKNKPADDNENMQVVKIVKEAGEYLLEKINAKGKSLTEMYRKDKAEHPELFNVQKNNNGGAK